MKLTAALILVLGSISSHGLPDNSDAIIFPDSERKPLQPPRECINGDRICGGDKNLYPVDYVEKIVENTLGVGFLSTEDQFFKAPVELSNRIELGPFTDKESGLTACTSVTETIPVMARAMNRRGKWKYLAQKHGNQVQHHQIVKCQNPANKCINDKDSPTGIENSTICRQLFKTARMIALDEEGELEVDSFRLPSACVCHFIRHPSMFRLRKGPQPQTDREVCEVPVEPLVNSEIERLVSLRQRFLNSQFSRKRANKRVNFSEEQRILQTGSDESFVERCPDGEIMCDSGSEHYPENHIKPAIEDDKILNSRGFFKNVFGSACTLSNETALRNAFDHEEEALCNTKSRYIFPRRAQNVHGVWQYIVNTEEYEQGVTIGECGRRSRGRSCRYGGDRGNYPNSTKCQQQYTRHNMLAINEDGKIFVDTFKVPSTCVCSLIDQGLYSHRSEGK